MKRENSLTSFMDKNVLLANAPDKVVKDDSEQQFDWDNAMMSSDLNELRKKIGRPYSVNPKKPVTIRLDDKILEYFKSTGKGWQTRMNSALLEWIASH
ncbi:MULTISPECIES: BrnA antitoxin family protein [unclassified Lonepinella]|uniref:BrnA antitoxin family protein n=1 Tax=unclassified Lonepinella TaxID=2642006 RepID=UPI003F6E1E8D